MVFPEPPPPPENRVRHKPSGKRLFRVRALIAGLALFFCKNGGLFLT
jgi:hypothetical protein